MELYRHPKLALIMPLANAVVTQYPLTSLQLCEQESCDFQNPGLQILDFSVCAVGIGQPSDLNGAFETTQLSGPTGCEDINNPLSNCRDGGFRCPEGSIAVTCDAQVSCSFGETICRFDGFGVTHEGVFVSCPSDGERAG